MTPAAALPLAAIGLDVIDQFISVSKTVADLAQLALPQYQRAAADMHQVCLNILTANKNLLRLINGFVYFNFDDPAYKKDFVKLYKSYKDLKVSPKFQELKFSCGDINNVYRLNIEDKIGSWFGNLQKQEEVKGIFEQMSNVDADLEKLIYEQLVAVFETQVNRIRESVMKSDSIGAEERRFELEMTFDPVIEKLVGLNSALAELVVKFANKARVPITLKRVS